MTDHPRAFAYADSYGTWYARVPKDCVSPLIAARRLLRDELTSRYANVATSVWMRPVRVPELDFEGTMCYREGGPE